MKILGISAHYHDSAAALVVDGVPIASVQEERISRRKNDAAFPLGAIEWCLETGGLKPEDLDAVVFYEKPMLKFERILMMALRAFPRTWKSFPKAMKTSLSEKIWVKGVISSYLGVGGDKVLFTEHHQSHAAAAFLTAPTKHAAIFTTDGVGEWTTLSAGVGDRTKDKTTIDIKREIRFPSSLGMFYSTITSFLGFEVNEGEYKVMGLASYGEPRFEAQIKKMIPRTDDGAFTLDLSYYDFHTTAVRSYSQRLVDELGPPRHPFDPLDPTTKEGKHYADIAASAQRVLEDILVAMTKQLHEETGCADLCLGGGVALNGCANARILRESGFERVFVPPSPGDAGCALGAALYADRIHFGNPDRDVPDHPFWGPVADPADLARIANEDGLGLETISDDKEHLAALAREIHRGKIVGWIDGGCELGPRALGNRSILASPARVDTRDRLNKEIKYREEFRPFAPAVPIEVADRYFELPPGGARMGRFMCGVFPVKPEWREKLAAITHIDGTARVQTVDKEMAPRFHALLEAFGEISGFPILLNTSFNLAGEPIVNRVVEGYSTFRRCGMDLLVCGPHTVRKKGESAETADESGVPVPDTALEEEREEKREVAC